MTEHPNAGGRLHLVGRGARLEGRGSAARVDVSAERAPVADDARVTVGPLDLERLDTSTLARSAPGQDFDLVLLPLFSDERPLTGLAALIDWRVCGRLSDLLRREVCRGGAGEAVMTTVARCAGMWRVVLYGLGPRAAFGEPEAANAAGQLRALARSVDASAILVGIPGGLSGAAAGSRLAVALEQTFALDLDRDPGDDAHDGERDRSAGARGDDSARGRFEARDGAARWWAVSAVGA